ncbi:MAG TPA: hypothetical protein PKC30_10145 [Saprospiraceae bacterium]|nr:hypothetical protein [Saprospiraceae bacterium]
MKILDILSHSTLSELRIIGPHYPPVLPAVTHIELIRSWGWDYSLTEYETFPLSRVVNVTPLGGMSPVEYSYRHNNEDDVLLVLPSPFLWPDNNHTKGVQPFIHCSLPNQHTPSSETNYDERDLFYSILHYEKKYRAVLHQSNTTAIYPMESGRSRAGGSRCMDIFMMNTIE